MAVEELQCPVCRARFRSQQLCSRCGADLSGLMTIAGRAFLLRQASRQALCSRQFQRALQLAQKSRELAETPSAAKLCVLLSWLCRTQSVASPPNLG